MLFTIALKELRANLISSRFALGFFLCLFLIPFTMAVNIGNYEDQQKAYLADLKTAEPASEIRVYANIQPVIVKPPEPLSIFSGGISSQVGNLAYVRLGEKLMFTTGGRATRDNLFMNAFFSLDFASVLAAILSLLALLFTYDACSGERENGTLRLILAGRISRSSFLLGKVFGVTLTLLPIVLFCYLLSTLIILVNPNILFGPDEWGRIALMFGMSVLLFLLYAALGLFVSTRVRSSVTGIIVCLFLWVVSVFIIPNAAVYIAQSFIKPDRAETLRAATAELDKEFQRKYDEYSRTLPEGNQGEVRVMTAGESIMIYGKDAPSQIERYRRLNEYKMPLLIAYADKKWVLQQTYLEKLDHQRKFAGRLALLSPSEAFQQAVSALCRTDANAYSRYMECIRRYREELIGFLTENKMFSSPLYFTRPEFVTANPFACPLLTVHGLPMFHAERATASEDILRSFVSVAGLALECVLLFLLSFVSFLRFDVR